MTLANIRNCSLFTTLLVHKMTSCLCIFFLKKTHDIKLTLKSDDNGGGICVVSSEQEQKMDIVWVGFEETDSKQS